MIVHIEGETGRCPITTRDYIRGRYCVFKLAGLTMHYTCPSHGHVVIWAQQEDGTVIPGDEARGRDWSKQVVGIVETLVWQCTESMIEELPDEDPVGPERNVG